MFTQIFNSSQPYTPDTIHMYNNCHDFPRMIGSLVTVLQEISNACVHTKPRGIGVTCIISGYREQPV